MASPVDRAGIENTHRTVFQLIYGPVCQTFLFESLGDTAMGAAILCPAVCVGDILNKASMCGKTIEYVMWQDY